MCAILGGGARRPTPLDSSAPSAGPRACALGSDARARWEASRWISPERKRAGPARACILVGGGRLLHASSPDPALTLRARMAWFPRVSSTCRRFLCRFAPTSLSNGASRCTLPSRSLDPSIPFAEHASAARKARHPRRWTSRTDESAQGGPVARVHDACTGLRSAGSGTRACRDMPPMSSGDTLPALRHCCANHYRQVSRPCLPGRLRVLIVTTVKETARS